jgi:hypothetical protein
VDGDQVSGIDNGTPQCAGLESIEIHPDSSVTRIESPTFFNCWALTRISSPARLPPLRHTICSPAFPECANVIDLDFPDDSPLTTIGERAFCGLTGLAAIILAQSMDSIGEYAFTDCSAVIALRLPQWNAPVREV